MTKTATRKNEYFKIKKTLLINTVGILVILLLPDSESSYSFFFYLFNILFVAINIFLILFISRLGKRINFFIFLLAAAVAFFTSYDYYIHGSQTVYLIWILFGFVYIGLAVFKEFPKLKTE